MKEVEGIPSSSTWTGAREFLMRCGQMRPTSIGANLSDAGGNAKQNEAKPQPEQAVAEEAGAIAMEAGATKAAEAEAKPQATHPGSQQSYGTSSPQNNNKYTAKDGAMPPVEEAGMSSTLVPIQAAPPSPITRTRTGTMINPLNRHESESNRCAAALGP